jgi:peptidoglycan/LPS O-acetylase OafA/YrhL
MLKIGYDAQPRPHRIPSLDGLRGISIWAVILAHASNHFQAEVLQVHLFHSGVWIIAYFGVTVFFVISGFLITSLLIK